MVNMNTVDKLDEALLSEYLRGKIPAFSGLLTATKFSGGQSNPTFKLETDHQTYVLRRQPPGNLLKSAHAVDREFRVLKALQDSAVPVANAHHLCEDTDIIGSMFYIMEYVDGNIYWDSSLADVPDNQYRRAMYEEMCNVMAHLHKVDFAKVGLDDFGRPGSYFSRQLSRWTKQYQLSETYVIPEMNILINWLNDSLPEDDGLVSLVHGDYRLDNLMFSKPELQTQPQVMAVLDWELSTLGHPLADLAYQCMQLRLPSNIGQSTGLGNIDRTSLGIPSEQEYVAMYCDKMGFGKIDNWQFYLAFSFFRLAAIAQGVAKRALDGNASSQQALNVGKMVQPLATMAIDLIE